MPLPITNSDYQSARQSVRNQRIRIDLLNFNFQTVEQIEGVAVSGSLTIDADSDIRRTVALTIVVADSSFNIENDGKIWMDKYIQIYMGIDNIQTNETNWTNMGIYIINDPTRVYSADENTLQFQAVDLMGKMTGLRNGYIVGVPTIIPQGSSIREAMISVVTQLGGFTKYVIEDNPQTVPYDIQVERAATVYDLLTQLRDISPNYEIYFDVDGVFHYQLIPSGRDDPILVDNDLWDYVVTEVKTTTYFTEVKNYIEVWGHAHDPSVYVDKVTVDGSTYTGTATGLADLTEYIVVGFVPPSVVENPSLKINDFDALPIVNEDGSPAVFPDADETYYVLQVQEGAKSFLYLGRQQIYASIQETNPDSPFYVNGPVGSIRYVCTGGEYDDIWTDDLALQRAEYELYLRARLTDSITLTCVPVFWLDVNTKVEYINEDVGLTNKSWNVQTQQYDLPSQFIIKSISMGLGESDTMSVTMARFYPLYPFW